MLVLFVFFLVALSTSQEYLNCFNSANTISISDSLNDLIRNEEVSSRHSSDNEFY